MVDSPIRWLRYLNRVLEELAFRLISTEGCLYSNGRIIIHVFRAIGSMKEHWRKAHGWAIQEKSGGRNKRDRETVGDNIDRFCELVNCQQAFMSQGGRHFIYIQRSEAHEESEIGLVPRSDVCQFMETIGR